MVMGKGSNNQRTVIFGALLAGTCLATPAFAQTPPPPPVRSPLDGNGVNLASGDAQFSTNELSIGVPGSGGLTYGRAWVNGYGRGWYHNFFIALNGGNTVNSLLVYLGGQSRSFSLNGSVYTSDQGDGSSIVASGTNYLYTTSDGTIYTFDNSHSGYFYSSSDGSGGPVGIPATKIEKPSGEIVTLTYKTYSDGTYNYYRLQSINNNFGYQLKLSYNSSEPSNITQVMAINNAVDYCDPTADSCTGLTQAWPTSTYSSSVVDGVTQQTVIDPLGRASRYSTSASLLRGVKRPSSANDDLTFTYDGLLKVVSGTRDGITWNYAWAQTGTTLTATITDSLSRQRVISSDVNQMVVLSDKDALNRTVISTYDANGRPVTITAPEGNYTQYGYDARGNVTTVTAFAKPGSGLANIVTSAVYPTSCANVATCNQPTSVTDANGHTTSYTYDPVHGGVLTITQPLVGGVSPQTRYTYTALQAYYKNSSGGIVGSGLGLYRLTAISSCRTTASCAGGADEVKSTIAYGSTAVANNLVPTSMSSGSGDGLLTAASSITYDAVGNPYTNMDPLSRITRYRYDADREVVGVVGPDPDGAGVLKNRARRITYNADGLVTVAEQGTVPSQSDADWASFATLQQVATTYDNADRKARDAALAGGTTYAVAQYSYDAASRLDCTAQRMNPAAFGSLPGACTVGTAGSFGADRISKTIYDAADEVTQMQTGYGTPLQRNEATATYNANGTQATLADANNNLTTTIYDGFDRLSKTEYPSPTTAGTSSTTDYEQLGYDPAGNVTSRRLRDGNSIGYSYDVLNRQTFMDLPATGNVTDSDVTYSYDLLGHLLQAIDTNTHRATYTYDALGRSLSEASPWATKAMLYDLAGRRTRLTWQDGFYVSYDYDAVNEMTAIHENGGTSLATFGYDDLGRRTSRTLANGTSTSYGFDAVSRLTSLGLAGGTNTNAITLSSYSPAGEIGSRTASNDAFAWTQGANANRGYVPNGLNQYATIAGATQGYDSKGNMTSSGGVSYAYNSKNQMTGSGSNGFYYDPIGRMDDASGSNVLFDYDGANMISELNTSTAAILRRYVFGPGGDEPIVWYEGAGATDKRYMDQDERGSITRITDGSGATIALNSYDEYGIPASTNQGRFQYTGQSWLPEIGMYNYKARIYSPTLGRFMQTDPIGYGDGPNWYNYAHGNPVGGSDPSGLADPHLRENDRQPPCQNMCTGGAFAPAPGVFASIGYSDSAGAGAGTSGRDGVIAQRYITSFDGLPDLVSDWFPVNYSSPNFSNIVGGSPQSGYAVRDRDGKPLVDDFTGITVRAPIPNVMNAIADFAYSQRALGYTAALEGLSQFHQGGEFDFQRYGGKFNPSYVDISTIAIGYYSHLAGISFNSVLTISNVYASFFSNFHGAPMDPIWTYLGARNVANTRQGFNF
jgi:RHS repeat-associated protein